jgi:hypothetical protein
MDIVFLLIAISVATLAFIFIYKRIKKSQTIINNPIIDNNAQNFYDQKKYGGKKKLTIQEKLELSWQFLFDITEIVLNKFSIEDQNRVKQLGTILLTHGMKYEHVVALAIKQDITHAHKANITQEQSKKQSHGRAS